jgi:periplasmic divalent cation tolerance protein
MYQVVLVTFPDADAALDVAKTLLNEKLAACINILPKMQAVYCWKDELRVDSEVQMVIKTTKDKFEQLNERICQIHSYEIAEVIALDIQQGNAPYLNWIKESLN